MQHLLKQAGWGADAVRGEARGFVLEHLGAEEDVFVVARPGLSSLPRTEAQGVLKYLFQVSAEDLFAVRPQITAPGGRRVVENEPTGSNARGFGHGNVEDVVMAATHESARFAIGAEQSNVGPHTLEQMDADIRRIVTIYPNRPVRPLFLPPGVAAS